MAREALGVILLKYNFSMFSQISPTVTRGNGEWAVFFKSRNKGGRGADFLRYSHCFNSCENLQNFDAVSVQ